MFRLYSVSRVEIWGLFLKFINQGFLSRVCV